MLTDPCNLICVGAQLTCHNIVIYFCHQVCFLCSNVLAATPFCCFSPWERVNGDIPDQASSSKYNAHNTRHQQLHKTASNDKEIVTVVLNAY